MSPFFQHLQPLSSISAMLGNTLRSWSGWTDPSTACTCECASRCVCPSGHSQPISPQTADDMWRSSSSDTYEQPCTVSSISSYSITVIMGKIMSSFPLQWSLSILNNDTFYLCCHTLSYKVDSFTPRGESQWSDVKWRMKQLILFDFQIQFVRCYTLKVRTI